MESSVPFGYSVVKDTMVVVIKEKVTYFNCINFNEFIETILFSSDTNDLILDLEECTFMDSTALGLLAKIAKNKILNKKPKPYIVTSNRSLIDTIDSYDLSSFFNMLNANFLEVNEQISINTSEFDKSKLSSLILEAHKHLSSISEENRQKFEGVISQFEKNL